MSGDQLVECLKSLGYPEDLDGKSLDWMFEDPTVAPFLEWFCSSLNKDNVVTPREIDE